MLVNGKHALVIADRFSGLVNMYDLANTGKTIEVVVALHHFLHNHSSRLKHIYWDNASNFMSREMEDWAERGNVILENLATYNLLSNLLVETNIKRCKQQPTDSSLPTG
jgi:hypothetical protein